MKKIVYAALLLIIAAGCKPGPVVLQGTITGYDGQEVEAVLSQSLQREAVEVSPDGTFHIEKYIDESFVGGISVLKGGSYYGLIIPGKTYDFSIDLTSKPAQWDVRNDCPAEQEFYGYMRDTLLKIDYANYEFPDRFADYQAMWDSRMETCAKKISSVKNRSALKYFNQTIGTSVASNKVNFAHQLVKKGLNPADDPEYMEFFNGVDLSDENSASLLRIMITIKSDMYSDTIPAGKRYIMALDELAPTHAVRDSLALKYIDGVIKDGKIGSRSEGDFLLENVSGLVQDQEQLDIYRSKVEKALSLIAGCDAIDFPITDPAGKRTSLLAYKGKVVYVDFWATWCIPCCIQIPYMKQLAARYESNPDVACISVSLDSNVAQWKSFLAQDKPKWPQFIADNDGRQIMSDYGFQAIPRFMLFDKEGRIVSANAPRPQNLEEVVEIIESLLQ